MARLLALALAILTGGCSLMIDGPRRAPPNRFPACEEDSTLPVIDAAFGGLFLVSGAVLLSDSGDDLDDDGVLTALAISAGFTALFGGAAWSGFDKTRRCSRVRDEYRRRYAEYQRTLMRPAVPSIQLGPPSSATWPVTPPAAPPPPPPTLGPPGGE